MGTDTVRQGWLSRMLLGDAPERLAARIAALEAQVATQAAALAALETERAADAAAAAGVATQLLDLADAIERQRLVLVGYDKRLHWHADEVRKLGTALIERIEFGRAAPAG